MPVDDQNADAPAMDELLLHFARTAFFERRPKKIAVAISGGSDSTALLHIYARLGQAEGLQIAAVTVDHGLRAEAADEAAAVSELCADLRVPHTVLHWDGWTGAGNMMAAAREARYRLIADWARSAKVDAVVLGHTSDDQAENFVIRLARKSGPDGLASMDRVFERFGMLWARPMLQQSRSDLRQYLSRNGVNWIEDPTNEDEQFERTRVRKALVTLAELGISADVLNEVSMQMSMCSSALQHYTWVECSAHVVQEQGDLVMPKRKRPPLPSEIERRIMVNALMWVGGLVHSPRASSMMSLNAGLLSSGKHTLSGCVVTLEKDVLRICREYNAVAQTNSKTDQIWDGRWALEGPHDAALEVRALGEGIKECPDWRNTGLPHLSLIASPSVWRDETLVAAPVAGLCNGWTAQIVADFHSEAFEH